MMTLSVLLGFGIMALIQVPPMVRKKWWRDLILYSVIFLLAFGSALSYSLNGPVLSPVKLLTLLMTTLYRYLGYEVPPQ